MATELATKTLKTAHQLLLELVLEPCWEQVQQADSRTAAKLTIGLIILLPIIFYAYQFFTFFCAIRKISMHVDKLPGEPKHWLWGNLHQHPGGGPKGLEYALKMVEKYPKIFRFWMGPFRCIVWCTHPSTAKVIMQSSQPKQLSSKGGYAMLWDWIGRGLLTSSGQQWFRNRRLLTPAFHFDVLKPYMQIYNEAADILLEKWTTESAGGNSVEIYQPISLCTLNVIMRCAFSRDDDVQRKGKQHPYVRAVFDMTELIVQRNFNPIKYFDVIYYQTKEGRQFRDMCQYAHKIAYGLINERKKDLEENPDSANKRYKDFLDILLLAKDSSGNGLNESEMRQEVDTFLFEGHDTTASALTFCLYALATHAEEQEKAYREVRSQVAASSSDYLAWEDLTALPHLTKCIKESLRLTPPVPFIGRELSKPITIDGVSLQPGTFINTSIWGLHHNPEVWGDDHMEFKPDRFDHCNMKDMDSFAFIPFAGGPRNCIGQNFAMHELKVIISRVLLKFRLSADPDHLVERKSQLVIRANIGIKLYLEPRH